MSEKALAAAFRVAEGKYEEGDLEIDLEKDLERIEDILPKDKKAKLQKYELTIPEQEDEKDAKGEERKCKLFATEKQDAVVIVGASRSKLVIFYMVDQSDD